MGHTRFIGNRSKPGACALWGQLWKKWWEKRCVAFIGWDEITSRVKTQIPFSGGIIQQKQGVRHRRWDNGEFRQIT